MTPDHTTMMTPEEIRRYNYRRACRFAAAYGLPPPPKTLDAPKPKNEHHHEPKREKP